MRHRWDLGYLEAFSCVAEDEGSASHCHGDWWKQHELVREACLPATAVLEVSNPRIMSFFYM